MAYGLNGYSTQVLAETNARLIIPYKLTPMKQEIVPYPASVVKAFSLWVKFSAYAALMEGKEVTWMPAYGPEQRGGTANVTVIISDEPISSPILSRYDTAILLNQPSLDKFQPKVKPGGTLIYDSSAFLKNLHARTLHLGKSLPWKRLPKCH